MTDKKTKTTIDISQLSIEQLYTLNRYVVDRIDELQAKQDREALAKLRPGMKVQFTHEGRTITGTLLKKNRKTVLIANNNGNTHHKVPAGMVTVGINVKLIQWISFQLILTVIYECRCDRA